MLSSATPYDLVIHMVLSMHTNSQRWNSGSLTPQADGLIVLGQLGQSLDGQIATSTGQSKYINDDGGLRHLHHLRAWADVVVVGVGTVLADDPQLTVRLARGSHPDRVIIDPHGRVSRHAHCLQEATVRRVVITHEPQRRDQSAGVEYVELPSEDGRIDAAVMRAWFARQGWRKVLIEGGAKTLAHFVSAKQLDYLHLITAPLLLGSGTRGLQMTVAKTLDGVDRFKTSLVSLGRDLLMQCELQ